MYPITVHAVKDQCILDVPVAWNKHRGLDLKDTSGDQCGTPEDIQDFLKSLREADVTDDSRDVFIIVHPAAGGHAMDSKKFFEFISGKIHPANYQSFDVLYGEEVNFSDILNILA